MTESDGGVHPLEPPPEPAASDRWAAAGEVAICSGVPSQILLREVMALAGLAPAGEGDALTLPFVAGLLLGDTVVLIGLMLILLHLRGESPRALWLGRRTPGWEATYGLLLVPAIFMVVAILLNALRLVAPWLHNVPANPFETIAAGDTADAAILGVVAIIAGGVREELQRAFLLRRFERYLGGRTVGVLFVSTAFGLGHYMQGWDAAIVTAGLGAFWGVMYLRRGSSVAPLVSHAGFNSLEILRVAVMRAGS
jgi:membrane protease YdiL (CAAX protease family)